MKLLFSVVIPTCNRNDLLANCLQCLRPGAQTLDAALYEVIVSDDSPNFESADLVKIEFPWVRYTPGPKHGPAANRNNGARLAIGDWLVFTDDDCLPDSNWLQAYAAAIEQRPDCSAFEGSVFTEREKKSAIEDAPINTTGGNFWSSNISIRHAFFIEIGGFDEHFLFPHLEDIDLKKRIEKNEGSEIYFVTEAMVIHPWRKVKPGTVLARYHSSEFYYFQIKQGIKITRYELFRKIVAARLNPLKAHFSVMSAVYIVGNLIQELVLSQYYFKKWDSQYPIKHH